MQPNCPGYQERLRLSSWNRNSSRTGKPRKNRTRRETFWTRINDRNLPSCFGHARLRRRSGQSVKEAQWPIGYGVGLRIKWSSVRIRPWPLRWVLGQGSLLPLSQGESFTLASISYLAILVKYILAKKKKKKKRLQISALGRKFAISHGSNQLIQC